MRMLTLFESRYTLKGRYNIGNVGKTASMSMLTLFESRYTLKGRCNIGNVGRYCFYENAYSLWIKIYIDREGATLVMLAKLLLWDYAYSLWIKILPTLKGQVPIYWYMLAKLLLWGMLTLFESRYTLKGRYNIGNVKQKLLLCRMSILSLNQDIHWRESTTLVMLAKLLLWVDTTKIFTTLWTGQLSVVPIHSPIRPSKKTNMFSDPRRFLFGVKQWILFLFLPIQIIF